MEFMRKEKGIKRLLAVALALVLVVPAGLGLVVPRVGAADSDSLTLKAGDELSSGFTEAAETAWPVTEVSTEYSTTTNSAIDPAQGAAIRAASESDATAVTPPAFTMDDKTAVMPMALDLFGDSSDLADFLTGVVIKDANDNVIDPNTGVVHAGETYFLTFRFAEVPDNLDEPYRQFRYDGGVLTYQLPGNVNVPAVQDEEIPGSTPGKDIGTYSIDTNGLVTVRFEEVDITGAPTPGVNFIDSSGAYFTLELEAKFSAGGGGGSVPIDFGNDFTVTLTVDAKPYLIVTKTAGNFNPENRTIAYTVNLTAHNVPSGETVNNITLTDVMRMYAPGWGSGAGSPLLSIAGQPLVNGDPVNATSSNNGAIQQGTYTRQYGIPLTGVSLADGQSANATYSVRVADALFDNADNSLSGNAYSLNNTVTATGSYNGAPVTANDDASAHFAVTHLSKEGSLNDANGNGKADEGDSITWTVYAGNGSTDLRGATITDVLGPGLEMQSNTIRVRLYRDADATSLISAYTQGNANFSYLNPAVSPTGFTLTVPTAPTVSSEVKRVVITYTSTITELAAGYSNTVTLRYSGGSEFSETASLLEMSVDKTGALVRNGNGGIEYTIRINAPGSLYGGILTITDPLYFKPFGLSFESAAPLDNKPEGMMVKIETKDGIVSSDDYTWDLIYGDDPVAAELGMDSQKNAWALLFNASRINGVPNLNSWNIAEDSVVTVTYTLPPTAKVLGGAYEGKTLAEALNYGVVYNVASVYAYAGDQEYSFWDDDFLGKPIMKSGEKTYKDSSNNWLTGSGSSHEEAFRAAADKGYFYTVLLNPDPDFAPYNLAPAGTPPVFSDSFDPRLELDEASVTIYRGTVGSAGYTVNSSDITVTQGVDGERSTFGFSFANAKRNGSQTISLNSSSRYYVTYRLRLPEAAENLLGLGVTKFPNTATVTITDSAGQKSYDADAQVDYGKPIITKEMKPASNTTVNVEIIVNPERKELAKGENVTTITVIDKMSDSLAFIDLSGIEVTNSDDNLPVSYTSLAYDPKENAVTFHGLPDKTEIKITYKALVIGAPGKTVEISNQVWITGYSNDEAAVNTGFEIVKSSASAGVTEAMFYLLKSDKQTNMPLRGAGFALYKNAAYSGWETVTLHDGMDESERTIDIPTGRPGAGTYYFIMWAETNENGLIVFDDSDIQTGRTFLLIETNAPNGYIKPEEQLLFYMLTGEDDETPPNDVENIMDGGSVVVTNEAKGGARFPDTGGPGTAPYILGSAGVMLIVLSAALLRTGRRRGFFYGSV
jgi:fimbrial isopeptide formation D2 family protein